ncbi:MAG: FxsA family protein [Wolinella sp.]
MIKLFFILYLLLEVLFTLHIGEELGAIALFFEIVLSAFVGITILLNLKYSFADTFSMLRDGRLSHGEFVSAGVLKILGAIFLILPGLLGDLFGILMQFGIFGGRIFRLFNPHKEHGHKRGNRRGKCSIDCVIDVEVIERDKKDKD